MPLRPLGVGELLDGALGLIRSNPKTVLGLAAAISAVSALLQTLGLWASFLILGDQTFSSATTETELETQITASLSSTAVQLVPALMASLLQVVASGLFMVLVGAAVLGRRLDAGQTWVLLRPRIWALIGLTLLLSLAGFLAVAGIIGVLVVLGMLAGGWGVAIGVLIGIAGALALAFLWVRLSLASPVLVIEGRAPIASLGRSWRLVSGSFWRVLGIQLLAAIIVNVLTAVVTVPFTLVASVATFASETTWPLILATGLATLVSGIVTLPFTAAVTGLLYTDLRIRREALDIELVAAGVDPTGDPLAPYRRTLA